MAVNPTGKVLVFGMDGATWDILQPLIDAGRCPTFARLQQGGAAGVLASTVHPHSPTAWSSFLTGMNPGGHGIFDFTKRKPGSYDIEVVSTRSRGGKAVWHVLSERGITCGVLNVPMTYPPEKVAGYFVSGVFTDNPFGNFSYPKTLLDDMKKALGHGYIVDAHRRQFEKTGEDPDPQELRDFLAELNDVERQRTDATLWLVQQHAPRFVVHVATSTDRAQHTFWRYLDATRADHDPRHEFARAIGETYVALDAELGRLCEAMGPDTTVLVMSDHGGGPLNRVLLVNAWLKAEGFLATVVPRLRKRLVRMAFKNAYMLGKQVLPQGLRARIAGRVDAGRKTTMKYMRPTEMDWSKTRAFSEGTFGNIILNVRGREPEGIVEPGAEYERLRGEIRARLQALKDPATGQPCVEKTYSREELYSGSRLADAPDIIVVLKPGYQMVGDFLAIHRGGGKVPVGTLFGSGEGNRFKISGIHTPDGILIAHGPGIAAGTRIADARIIDLAPTILHTFGVEKPADMDGAILTELTSR